MSYKITLKVGQVWIIRDGERLTVKGITISTHLDGSIYANVEYYIYDGEKATVSGTESGKDLIQNLIDDKAELVSS